jgi:hypothetical protein
VLWFVLGIPELLDCSPAIFAERLADPSFYRCDHLLDVEDGIRNRPSLRKKYRLSIILALAAPFLIGIIFKYLLLVPMPTEGLAVAVLDAVWYWDF